MQRRYIKSHASLRGIAALLVVFYHIQFGEHVRLFWEVDFFRKGYLWVDLFFILSGFVISYTAALGKHSWPQIKAFWRARFDGGSITQLIDQVSLYALEDYLKSSSKIAVMHNADDVILGTGDLGFLRRTFGDRLTVYPLGGHCGNLNYRVNSDAMLEFFRG